MLVSACALLINGQENIVGINEGIKKFNVIDLGLYKTGISHEMK